jgi:hypothetical protein
MSTVIAALVLIAIMLTTGMTMTGTAFTSVDHLAESWKQTEKSSLEAARSDVVVLNAETVGAFIEVQVHNTGGVHIGQFASWEVLVHYYDDSSGYHITRLQHSLEAAPGDDEWIVANIYTDDSLGQGEVFEPGILNPGEVLLIRITLAPAAGSGAACWVTVATPLGVAASAQFQS